MNKGNITKLLHHYLLAMLMLSQGNVYAHQLHTTTSYVAFDEQKQLIDIHHRFHVHELEHAVEILFSPKGELHSDSGLRDKLSRYVHQSFLMENQNGDELPITLKGSRIEHPFFWVHQQVSTPLNNVTQLNISYTALRDIWPQQKNLVEVNINNTQQMLVFSDGDIWHRVTID
ncbi:DUF6702 family protein (plasmid) [Pseudoalteromonas sp. T1lg65]|uniref:DUF6702 family protein n=1 Tax=Pseudoalteromonas sp. T1lg65 TaxID=2077101 RepID=UPI003F795F7F